MRIFQNMSMAACQQVSSDPADVNAGLSATRTAQCAATGTAKRHQ